MAGVHRHGLANFIEKRKVRASARFAKLGSEKLRQKISDACDHNLDIAFRVYSKAAVIRVTANGVPRIDLLPPEIVVDSSVGQLLVERRNVVALFEFYFAVDGDSSEPIFQDCACQESGHIDQLGLLLREEGFRHPEEVRIDRRRNVFLKAPQSAKLKVFLHSAKNG